MSNELPKNKPISENEAWINDLDAASKKAKERAKSREFILEPLEEEAAKESVPRKKLFLSVEGLMIDLLPRKLTKDEPNSETEIIQLKQSDLDTGLFYFGCTREEFFHLNYQGPAHKGPIYQEQVSFFKSPKQLKLLRKIIESVEKAEKEGRVFWREKRAAKEGFSYEDLNALLEHNNISTTIQSSELTGAVDFENEIRAQIEKSGLPLDVVG